MASVKNTEKAYNILSSYEGNNPYLLILKREVYINRNTLAIGDFQVEFILRNATQEPVIVNKLVKITDWYAKSKVEKKKVGGEMISDWVWENPNTYPERIKIISYLGDTTTTYCCYVQYRQSVPPCMCFLPKKAVIGNFLAKDYNTIQVDFDRYDRLSMAKDPNRKMKETQKTGVKFLLGRKKCILADDMGYGKTLEMCVAAIEGNFDSIIVICPASIKTGWKRELLYYVPERDITIIESFSDKNKGELEQFLGYSVGKSGKSRDQLLSEALEQGKWKDNRFVIMNYEVLDDLYEIPVSWGRVSVEKAFENSPLLQYIAGKKSLIIIDEAHRLSNSKSQQYKIIRDLIKRGNPDSIYLATGTPVTNNPQNLFCLLQLINSPVVADWNHYMERYCGATKFPAKGEKARLTNIFLTKKGKSSWYDLSNEEKDDLKKYIWDNARMVTKTDNATNLDELKEMISDIYLRRVKEDLEGMVNKTIHEVDYELTMEQMMEYEVLWDNYEAAVMAEQANKSADEGEPQELNKTLLEGAIYRRYLSNAMVPYTEKMVDNFISQGEKVVIACCFDEELYTLKEYYGEKCVIYNGKLNSKQKDTAIEKFTKDPSVMVFIGNIQAAGVGITLTVANKLVFNDMSYVPGDNFQMQDRICRIGQKRDCDIYYQIFKNTQYENIWNIVMRKAFTIDQIIKKESDK